MSIAILTFCVGADYKRAMEPGLESKRNYAKKHGYDLHIGGEDVWDRSRPIPWSKLKFIVQHIDNYDYLFVSDADVIILDPTQRLETFLHELLPPNKDLLWTLDACNHYNNGNMFLRGRNAWAKGFLERAYNQTELLHHIWWDNAGMIRLFEQPDDAKHIETTKSHWLFNAYVFGLGKQERLYKPGDFLIHFAGVYDIWNIYRMMKYVSERATHQQPVEFERLDVWRENPPLDRRGAEESLSEGTVRM